MRTVCFLCERIEHVKFFKNMEKAFKNISYDCLYLVLDISVFLQLKKATKKRMILITKKDFNCFTDSIYQSKDYLEKVITENYAKKLYKSVTYYCNKLNNEKKIDLFIVSQGILTAEIAVRDFAKSNSIPILFFELANIKGKTFWDIEGSNAKSYLYRHIEILDKYDIEYNEYINWKNEYIKNNFKQHVVKQAVNIKKFNYTYGLLSRISFLFTGIQLHKSDILKKLKFLINSRTLKLNYDKFNITKEKYIFFPMQVASDSQIILNSDISLFEGLKYAINRAKVDKCILVVKLHPAEKDVDIIKKVLKFREKYKFKIITDNTFQVIANAEKIITINSTVALEAMILDKPVEILGRSYYKFFNQNRIKNYILGYLENIDFFSDNEFSEEQVRKLVQKCQR